MKGYFSIDLETTGLDPKNNNILEVGGIFVYPGEKVDMEVLESQGRIFHCYVNVTDEELARGDDYALNLNKEIIKKIQTKEFGNLYLDQKDVLPNLYKWASRFLDEDEKMVVAGKNFGGFDVQFLKNLPGWNHSKMSARFLDPAMLFLDIYEDVYPPCLSACLSRAGLDDFVTHTAVEDAFQVAQLINYKM